MKQLLIESQYFGPIQTWQSIASSQLICIEARENYQKKSFRNKCFIIGANGLISLSVPLAKGKNNRMPITDVRINYDQDWRKSHLQTIQSAYGNAPYFDFYFEGVKALLEKRYDKLFELNLSIFNWLIKAMDLDVNIALTDRYEKQVSDHILDHRGKQNKKHMRHEGKIVYPQVFEEKHGFIHGVSVLDLLFCTGPEARLLLKAG